MKQPYDLIIIGSGLSGLALAHFFQKQRPRAKVLLLEKADRPGGAIRSFSRDGYLAEWGPHGFLDNSAASNELLIDTGLDQEAQRAPLASFVRYVCLNGRLRMIPQSPGRIIASSLLPFSAKLRVLAELRQKPLSGEPTVSQWISHRFGPALLPFADAVFTGTYAGDFDRLSIDAVMPGARNLEKEYGSVIRGVIKKRKEKRKQGKKKSGLPAMVSFPQGMTRLVEVLARDKDIRYGAEAERIRVTEKGGWQINAGGGTHTAQALALALSVNQGMALLAASGYPAPGPPLVEARIVNILMGFTRSAQIPFGFGYLAPEQEKRFALGALFSTHMFPGRAPDGRVLVEVLVGGRRHPEKLSLSDRELVEQAHADLKQLLHLPEPPCFTRVLRPGNGIPQPETGHARLRAWRARLMQELPGLFICGFGWQGIGINDMTRTARQLAAAIARGKAAAMDPAAVKGVYF
ncbi:MAG: protoporphyrinogen oxidase [Desulfobacterales bacterium]|nr:protoporphyrinogen oxidase [Desulfobacterales bacterium]